jgi:hypothetical protein
VLIVLSKKVVNCVVPPKMLIVLSNKVVNCVVLCIVFV